MGNSENAARNSERARICGDITTTDHRAHPECYRVGRGEQGVLQVEPYKSEILPYWRFRTPDIARKSAAAITRMFDTYRAAGDFVGMDMARKYLQMGFTRARRYANHPSGRKYDPQTKAQLPQASDWRTSEKAESARIFYAAYETAKTDPAYLKLKREHLKRYSEKSTKESTGRDP